MNVQHYFLGSPVFAKPAILIHHSATPDTPSPEELAALMELWQNPTYPDDSYFTTDMFNAEAREKSMKRAQVPSVLLCLLDTVDNVNHPAHAHTYSECMQYRASQAIGPSWPWTYWSEYDVFPFGLPPVEFPSLAPHGWTPIARVNPYGISEMNGWAGGWQAYTFVTQIGASKILTGWGPGKETRVMLAGAAIFKNCYIGPATNKAFVASQLFPLTFGGQNQFQIDYTYSDGGIAMPYTRYSDPVLQGISAPNGLIVCGYVVQPLAGWGAAYIQTRGYEPDWYSRGAAGDHASDLDKSKLGTPGLPGGWFQGGVSDIGVMMVEALY